MLDGSPIHLPISEYELNEWAAHFHLTNEEQKEANRTAGS